MTSWCGRYVLAFNGGVYNYRELRGELDYPFQTTGDTEVVLAALREWGRRLGALQRDVARPSGTRLKKGSSSPVTGWASSSCMSPGRTTVYAGPVKSVRCWHPDGWPSDWTGQGSRLPAIPDRPRSGHVGGRGRNAARRPRVVADDNEVRTECWWDAATQAEGLARMGEPWTYSLKPAAENVRGLLMDSVALRMRSDVPFGAFLSGGIDSSAVVALMSEISERPVSTFNVAFEEDEFDESQYARLMAKQCATDHHEVRLRAADFLEAVPEALAATDHPSGDGPNTFVVSQATKKAGLTVALSGLGGDELFAGYPVFRRTLDLMDRQWAMAWPRGLRKAVGQAYQTARPGVASRKFAALLAGDRLDPAATYPISRRLLLDADIAPLLPDRIAQDRVATWCAQQIQRPPGNALPVLSQVSLAELHTYMQHVLLRDTDQMSMAHALEVRVPFLDHRLVETVLAIRDDIKFPHTPKALLTAALGPRLPRQIIDRPKMGFTLPWDIWMRGALAPLCQSGLNTLATRGILDGPALNRLWVDFEAGRTTWSRIWNLAALGHGSNAMTSSKAPRPLVLVALDWYFPPTVQEDR